jgi:hypothetical protein
MFADPKKVKVRRIKRQLKAGASILVAMAAGAFLACKGGGEPQEASPYGPDARSGPDRSPEAGAARDDGAVRDAGAAADGATPDAADGGAPDAALVVRDAAADAAPDARAPRVDRKEHRKGMPVRDNLLE